MALIDPSVVKSLLITQLKTVSATSAGKLLLTYEADDPALSLWFRLVTLDSVPHPRRSGPAGEVDIETVTFVVNCHATDQATEDAGELLLDAAAAAVKSALVDATLTGSSHQLWIRSATVRDLASIDDSRAIRGRQLIFEAVASRATGVSTGGPVVTPPVSGIGD